MTIFEVEEEGYCCLKMKEELDEGSIERMNTRSPEGINFELYNLSVSYGDGYTSTVKINFCPFCGKKLVGVCWTCGKEFEFGGWKINNNII